MLLCSMVLGILILNLGDSQFGLSQLLRHYTTPSALFNTNPVINNLKHIPPRRFSTKVCPEASKSTHLKDFTASYPVSYIMH